MTVANHVLVGRRDRNRFTRITLVATLLVICGVGLDGHARVDVDEFEERDYRIAQESIKAFLAYRVTTARHDCDQIIKEYLKVLCGKIDRSPGPGWLRGQGTKPPDGTPLKPDRATILSGRIQRASVDDLFDLSSFSSAVTVGCGCFLSEFERADACGKLWADPGVWMRKDFE